MLDNLWALLPAGRADLLSPALSAPHLLTTIPRLPCAILETSMHQEPPRLLWALLCFVAQRRVTGWERVETLQFCLGTFRSHVLRDRSHPMQHEPMAKPWDAYVLRLWNPMGNFSIGPHSLGNWPGGFIEWLISYRDPPVLGLARGSVNQPLLEPKPLGPSVSILEETNHRRTDWGL